MRVARLKLFVPLLLLLPTGGHMQTSSDSDPIYLHVIVHIWDSPLVSTPISLPEVRKDFGFLSLFRGLQTLATCGHLRAVSSGHLPARFEGILSPDSR